MIVGDFTVALTLLVREAINVLLSDSAYDDFTRNRVTILAVSRVALPIWQPAALSIVYLSTLTP